MLITAKIEGMPYLMFELYCHTAITYVIKTIKKILERDWLSPARFQY